MTEKVHFVGAGPGAPDLITYRAKKYIDDADVIIYAGSLVNPAVLADAKKDAKIYNSAEMDLEEVLNVMIPAAKAGKKVVRVHTGDPSIYGAIREQMDRLDKAGVPYDDTPGVSSFCASAAAINKEFTLPGISQTVIITRMAGRTPMPSKEDLFGLAKHQASMCIFLSVSYMNELCHTLREAGYPMDTPVAVVYKASWPDQQIIVGNLTSMPELVKAAGITKTAMTMVGGFLGSKYELSKLYDPHFTTMYRQGKE